MGQKKSEDNTWRIARALRRIQNALNNVEQARILKKEEEAEDAIYGPQSYHGDAQEELDDAFKEAIGASREIVRLLGRGVPLPESINGEELKKACMSVRQDDDFDVPSVRKVIDHADLVLTDPKRRDVVKPAPQAEENIFRREGEYWTIRYRGNPIQLKDSKGLRYIHKLLSEPEKTFHVLGLARMDVDDDGREEEVTPSIIDDRLSITRIIDGIDVVDERDLKKIQKCLEDLKSNHAKAVDAGDGETAVDLTQKIESVEKYLAKATGLSGQPRKTADMTDKARKAVTKCIREALDRINEAHPVLWQHLKPAIKRGRRCRYQPTKKTDWLL